MKGWSWTATAPATSCPLHLLRRRKGFLTGLNFRAQCAIPHTAETSWDLSDKAARPQAQLATDSGAPWLLRLEATTTSPQITFAQISGTVEMSKVRETVVMQSWFSL